MKYVDSVSFEIVEKFKLQAPPHVVEAMTETVKRAQFPRFFLVSGP